MNKRVTVTKENDTGRNIRFRDNRTGTNMTDKQFVKAIENRKYINYHVRVINNIKTPISNPDNTANNNLN